VIFVISATEIVPNLTKTGFVQVARTDIMRIRNISAWLKEYWGQYVILLSTQEMIVKAESVLTEYAATMSVTDFAKAAM
jgi:hypothetical protein